MHNKHKRLYVKRLHNQFASIALIIAISSLLAGPVIASISLVFALGSLLQLLGNKQKGTMQASIATAIALFVIISSIQ